METNRRHEAKSKARSHATNGKFTKDKGPEFSSFIFGAIRGYRCGEDKRCFSSKASIALPWFIFAAA